MFFAAASTIEIFLPSIADVQCGSYVKLTKQQGKGVLFCPNLLIVHRWSYLS